jgi:hypothetical protein
MATKIIGKVSIVPYGDWQENTTYPRLAVVGYQGGSYIAVVENTNITPTDTSSWKQIAAAGNGISSIEKIGTVGLVDTYRITYTDGTHFDYTVNNGASKTSELTNDAGFITNQVDDLANYLLAVDTGAYIELLYDSEGYTVTANLKNSSETIISTSTAQLPLGGNYVSSSYDDGVITLTKLDGTSDTVELSDLVKKSTTIAGLDLGNDITTQELIEALDVYTIPEINDNFVSNSASGEIIYIDNSSNLTLKDFQIKGNATQDTSILTYKCVGTETGDYYFVYDNTNYQFTMPTISANDLLTFNTDTKKLYQGSTQITTTTASTGTLITLSSTPNPDYPQDIHIVTGDNTLNIWKSRNLFDESKLLLATDWTKNGNEYTGTSGNLYSKYKPEGGSSLIDNFIANTSYVISFTGKVDSSGGNGKFIVTYTDGTQDNTTLTVTSPNFATKKLVTDSSKTVSKINFSYGSGRTLTLKEFYIGLIDEAYEPYSTEQQTQLISLGSIELAKIGDYTDRIYKDNGKWYVEKNIEKIESYNGETINTDYISSTGGLDIGATVYYQLTTPTIIEITDTTLIGQLENVLKWRTYNNTTNIFVQTNNAQPYLYIDYYINNVEMIKDMQEENTKLYESLLDQIPVKQVSGDLINVQDSSNLPLKEIDVLGNATQFTTTGKNLFNLSAFNAPNSSISGDTIVLAGLNSFHATPVETTLATICPSLQVGQTYTLSFNTTFSGDNYNKLFISSTQTYWTKDTTLTMTQEILDSRFALYGSNNSVISNLMIRLSTESATYEPYTGGKASPNPDYPQDIHVVTGDNTVKVVGKNLFSGNFSQFDNIGGTGTTYAYFKLPKENTAYTLTMIAKNDFTPNSSTFIGFTTVGGQTSGSGSFYWLVSGSMSMIPAGTVLTYSTNSKSFISMFSNSAATLKKFTDNFNIILEESPSYTSYEPYTEQTQLLSLGDIEQAKIGTYQDKLFKAIQGNSVYDNLDSTTKASLTYGSWYKQGNIEKINSNNITFTTTSYENVYISSASQINKKYADKAFICTSFIYDSTHSIVNNESANYNMANNEMALRWSNNASERDRVYVKTDKTLEQLNALSYDLYFVAKTPTYTEITDTTLINQLEEILRKTTYKTTTNFWLEPSGTNAQGSLDIVYRQDLQTLTDKIEALEARVALLE